MCRVEISFTCYSSLEVLFFLRPARESLYPTKLKETIEGEILLASGVICLPLQLVCLGMNLSGIRELFCLGRKKKMTTHRLCI